MRIPPELARMFERSPVGMYRATEDGRFHYVNPALARMLGYTVDELLARNLDRDVYVDRAARPALIAAYRPRGSLDGARVEWRTKDGRRLIVQLYGQVTDDDASGEPSFDAWAVDVTATELARDELARTAATLDAVVAQLPALYWIVDRELRIVRTGGAVEALLGYPRDRFIGTTLREVHTVDPGSHDPVLTHRRALAGETVSYESEYRGKQLAVTLCPHVVDGEIRGVIGGAVDVTAARAIERRMIDAQRAESLGLLAGGLAHDFSNLLIAILGNAELGLRDTAPTAPGRSALENIRDAGLRAAELTDQLLAYAGRGVATAGRVAPRPLVDELLRILSPTLPAAIAIDVDIPDDLALRGDPTQVRQVVLNLIHNARDAVAETGGAIKITGAAIDHPGGVRLEDVVSAPPGRYVQLVVADTGAGIDREARRRIFEPFFTTKPAGHGLGLAAVLGIVRSHHGGLRLVSERGAGTRFEVLWPAEAAAAPRRAAALAPRTVLVIDDEDLVRDVVARMIEDLGYAAVTAADGLAGLEVVEQRSIDAVLVDLTMPRMSGADLIATLRSRRPTMPIVLCSGFDRDRRGPVQADAYLPKPFRIETLEQTLAKIFG